MDSTSSLDNSDLNEDEKIDYIKEIKKQNIKLINELYLKNLIPYKVIQDCCEFLQIDSNENKIILLCELTKGIFSKLIKENCKDLEKALNFLEKIM